MFKLRTIAEGVENACQRKQLHDLGCHAGQGYLFGRLVAPREMDALLATEAEFQTAESARGWSSLGAGEA